MTAAEAGPASPAPSRTRLVLVRHGETDWSRSGRHTGRTDIPLTDRGREQAERLGQALRGRTFSRVLSSPLGRALETCRLAGFGDRAELDDDLREWDYGVYEGRTRLEIAAEVPGWSIWTHPIVGGDVLVFAHGHILRVLAARWIEQRPLLGSRLALATATLSELGWEHDTRVIEGWNAMDAPAS